MVDIEVARKIEKHTTGGKRNPIVDKFIEVLEENPEVEILSVTDTKVDWRFKIDSPTIRDNIGVFQSYDEMTEEQLEQCHKLEEEHLLAFTKEAHSRLGVVRTLRTLMGGQK
ncbi:MAG: hypothetical protein ACTSX2_05485 [Candidatus Thorarchaeota archaeon]